MSDPAFQRESGSCTSLQHDAVVLMSTAAAKIIAWTLFSFSFLIFLSFVFPTSSSPEMDRHTSLPQQSDSVDSVCVLIGYCLLSVFLMIPRTCSCGFSCVLLHPVRWIINCGLIFQKTWESQPMGHLCVSFLSPVLCHFIFSFFVFRCSSYFFPVFFTTQR